MLNLEANSMLFLHFLSFFTHKTLKKHILTSVWSVQYQNAGQNTLTLSVFFIPSSYKVKFSHLYSVFLASLGKTGKNARNKISTGKQGAKQALFRWAKHTFCSHNFFANLNQRNDWFHIHNKDKLWLPVYSLCVYGVNIQIDEFLQFPNLFCHRQFKGLQLCPIYLNECTIEYAHT